MAQSRRSESDEDLVEELEEDRQAVKESRDPMGLGRDPDLSETVEEIAEKRTRT